MKEGERERDRTRGTEIVDYTNSGRDKDRERGRERIRETMIKIKKKRKIIGIERGERLGETLTKIKKNVINQREKAKSRANDPNTVSFFVFISTSVGPRAARQRPPSSHAAGRLLRFFMSLSVCLCVICRRKPRGVKPRDFVFFFFSFSTATE